MHKWTGSDVKCECPRSDAEWAGGGEGSVQRGRQHRSLHKLSRPPRVSAALLHAGCTEAR